MLVRAAFRRGAALSAGTMPRCLTHGVTLDFVFPPFPFQSERKNVHGAGRTSG